MPVDAARLPPVLPCAAESCPIGMAEDDRTL